MMRRMGPWLTLAVLGALAAVVGCSWTWAADEAPLLADGGPTVAIDITGRELAAAATPAALVGLAGVLAVIATAGAVRTAIGALMAMAGVLAGLSVVSSGSRAVGALIALAGSIALAVSGAAVVRLGRGWPVLGRRFERADAGAAPTASPWDALDRGADPTDLPPG